MLGSILWKIWIMRLPRHIAAYSFVPGAKSFLATLMISSALTISNISLLPAKMKFFKAAVPWRIKNISSDFCTNPINWGKTAIIFLNSFGKISLSVFLSKLQSRSRTCYKIVESTTLRILVSSKDVGFNFSLDESKELDSETNCKIWSLFSSFGVDL